MNNIWPQSTLDTSQQYRSTISAEKTVQKGVLSQLARSEVLYLIRKSEQNDIDQIFQIWNEAHHHNYGWNTVEEIPPDLIEIASNMQSYLFLNEDKVVGWIAWQVHGSNCILEALYVKPSFQRQGIARRLLRFMESKVKGDIASITAAVLKSGKFAIDFYGSQGFENCDMHSPKLAEMNDELKQYLDEKGDERHSVIMVKFLSSRPY